MKIGFIGAGKAGTSLGLWLHQNGIPISGYFSRSVESSRKAAVLTASSVCLDLETLLETSEMVYLTTPDDVIPSVAEEISHCLPRLQTNQTQFFIHMSGSLPSDVLSCIGTSVASSHPMITISSRQTDLSEAFFTLEGEKKTVAVLSALFRQCGNRTARIQTGKKALYHCAASMASNLMVALADLSVRKLEECGFERQQAMALLSPLMRGNIDAVCQSGPAAALTGPLERNDIKTVAKHLDSLHGRQKELYRLLSLELLHAAREKNKNRNYQQMQCLLEEMK